MELCKQSNTTMKVTTYQSNELIFVLFIGFKTTVYKKTV